MAPPARDPGRLPPVRYLLDEMYPGALAERLRADGFDVLAVLELPELVGEPDSAVAKYAHERGRVIVTENVGDYLSLEPADHAGLLLVNARRWPRSPAGLSRLRKALAAWMAEPAHREEGLVDWL